MYAIYFGFLLWVKLDYIRSATGANPCVELLSVTIYDGSKPAIKPHDDIILYYIDGKVIEVR